MNKYFVIVAGGSGTRMQAIIPKQFLLLDDKPILQHTLEHIHEAYAEATIVLVLPESEIGRWEELCIAHHCHVPHQVVVGGNTRFHSVKNGLLSIADDKGWVAVHDAVRPFVSKSLIEQLFQAAEQYQSAVPVVPIKDSLRRILTNKQSIAIDRSEIVAVQTPQVFELAQLKSVFNVEYQPTFTDEATLWEQAGQYVHSVAGADDNIKITTPDDLLLATLILKKFKQA